jgi:hypothetical protein
MPIERDVKVVKLATHIVDSVDDGGWVRGLVRRSVAELVRGGHGGGLVRVDGLGSVGGKTRLSCIYGGLKAGCIGGGVVSMCSGRWIGIVGVRWLGVARVSSGGIG